MICGNFPGFCCLICEWLKYTYSIANANRKLKKCLFLFHFRYGSNYVRVFQRYNNRILHHFDCMDCWSIWCHLLYYTNHQATLVEVNALFLCTLLWKLVIRQPNGIQLTRIWVAMAHEFGLKQQLSELQTRAREFQRWNITNFHVMWWFKRNVCTLRICLMIWAGMLSIVFAAIVFFWNDITSNHNLDNSIILFSICGEMTRQID